MGLCAGVWPVPQRSRAGEGGSGDGGDSEDSSELGTRSSLPAAHVPSFTPTFSNSGCRESLPCQGGLGPGSEVLEMPEGGAPGQEGLGTFLPAWGRVRQRPA